MNKTIRAKRTATRKIGTPKTKSQKVEEPTDDLPQYEFGSIHLFKLEKLVTGLTYDVGTEHHDHLLQLLVLMRDSDEDVRHQVVDILAGHLFSLTPDFRQYADALIETANPRLAGLKL
jgi:hypothetical protein